jgi:hypothetical protein
VWIEYYYVKILLSQLFKRVKKWRNSRQSFCWNCLRTMSDRKGFGKLWSKKSLRYRHLWINDWVSKE